MQGLLWLPPAVAWPTHAGSCFTADNGHVQRTPGTGGCALSLRGATAEERGGMAWLQLMLRDEEDGAAVRGFVVKALGGAGLVFPAGDLGEAQQNLDCGDGGALEEVVTHVSRRAKQHVVLTARMPLPETVHGVPLGTPLRATLAAIAMPEFSAWFKFRQQLTLTRDAETGALAATLGAATEVTRAHDEADKLIDGLGNDSVQELWRLVCADCAPARRHIPKIKNNMASRLLLACVIAARRPRTSNCAPAGSNACTRAAAARPRTT